MKKVVLDTSVFIDFSRAQKGGYLELKKLAGKGKVALFVPTVVVFEFWSGGSMDKVANVKKAEDIFAGIEKIELSEVIAKNAGQLVRKCDIRGFDALVAATALKLGAVLATENKKHFTKIKGLKIY